MIRCSKCGLMTNNSDICDYCLEEEDEEMESFVDDDEETDSWEEE